jgi:hypothetical protein
MFRQGFFWEWVLKENINLTRLRTGFFGILLHHLRQNNNVNGEASSTLHVTSSALVRSLHGIRRLLYKRSTGNFIKIITLGKHNVCTTSLTHFVGGKFKSNSSTRHLQQEVALQSANMPVGDDPRLGPLPVSQASSSKVGQLRLREVASHSRANNTQIHVTTVCDSKLKDIICIYSKI